MIIKIAKTEVEAMKLIAALASVKATFFTMETNEEMVQVELTEDDGRELSSKCTWHICRSFCAEVQIREIKNVKPC